MKSPNKLAQLILIFSTVFLIVPIANADFVGKNSGKQSPINNKSVKAILDNPVDDQNIELIGNITEKLRHEKYYFTDGTETIRVEIDDKDFPVEPVDENTRVKIYGEVENDFLESPEIDVKHVEILR